MERTKTKEDVKQVLEYTLKYVESSVESGVTGLVESMERLMQNIKYIAEDKRYEHDKKVYNMIHEIQWSIANMCFDSLAQRAAEYRTVKAQIEIIEEYESVE